MPEVSDMERLRNYSQQGSEEAFAGLVRQHVDLVYSAALRHVGIAAQAEEITQAVFVILARKAARLRPDTILDAWLYETTRLTALSFQRGERRRQWREQEAYMQSTHQESTGAPAWNQLAPLLDDAMSRLGRKDREAVVLRFFKEKSLREVAAALEVTEAAAQSRVHRAVEKLRRFYIKRGVALPAAVLTAVISAHSVQAAPAALAKTVTAVALAKGAAASGSTLTLIQGALKIMAWTKVKTAIVVGGVMILAAGTTPVFIHHYRTNASIFSSTKELSSSEDAKYANMTGMAPEQVAKSLLEAFGSEDWEKVATFFPPGDSSVDDYKRYGGLKIVSLGKPFKGRVIAWNNKEYAGIYVPYEIRLKGGEIKKWQLCIRCDNRAKHWYFDGGM